VCWLRLAKIAVRFVWPKCIRPSSSWPSAARAGTREHRPVIMGPRLRGDDRTENSRASDRNVHHVKQPISFPRRGFAPGLCIFASLTPIEGWAERRETFGCVRGTRFACHDAARQALARRHASHNAGRSPLGAPPWRFWAARGRASLTEHPPPPKLRPACGSVTASSSQPGRSAWRAASLPPETTVTSRRRTPHLAPPSGCLRTTPLNEQGCEPSNIDAFRSHEKMRFVARISSVAG
jgi:hypothetical protein